MAQKAKKQTAVAARVLKDGTLEILAIVDAPFVSSRLGPDVSCETKAEHDEEDEQLSDAVYSLNCGRVNEDAA